MEVSENETKRESIEDLRKRALRRARLALGRFGDGIVHVVLRPRGERGCRTFVVAQQSGSISVEEASA